MNLYKGKNPFAVFNPDFFVKIHFFHFDVA